ncbi:MAG: ABC transporter ATP-binding protein, partial [Gammaproteobacteria bacterium]
MNADVALSLHNLSVRIAGKDVCKNLDLELQAGTCVGILGANGVGKTTLLNTIAGLRKASTGRVKLLARDLEEWKRRDLAKHLGMLMQHHEDPFPATVLDTTLIGRHPHIENWRWESAQDEKIARAALAETDLEDLAQREVHALSGGERRR